MCHTVTFYVYIAYFILIQMPILFITLTFYLLYDSKT